MFGRSPIRGALLGLIVPTVLLLTGATASASCGDYVHVLPAGVATGAPAPPKAPCRGPNCQDAPRHPPAPAPTTAPSTAPQDAVLASFVTIDAAEGRWPLAECFPVPHHVPSGIFHPPRA